MPTSRFSSQSCSRSRKLCGALTGEGAPAGAASTGAGLATAVAAPPEVPPEGPLRAPPPCGAPLPFPPVGAGVVVCLQIFSGAMRLQDRASREVRAVLHARATMDALLFQREIENHTEERTTAEGYRTRILVRDAGPQDGIPETDFEPVLEFAPRVIEVEVAWQDGVGVKTYTLSSMRLASTEF